MSLKKDLQKILSNKQEKVEIFYLSAKIVFILQAFAFFVVYFLVSAHFYDDILYIMLLPLYVAFVVSFGLFLCAFLLKHTSKFPFFVSVLCMVFSFAIAGVFLIPVL